MIGLSGRQAYTSFQNFKLKVILFRAIIFPFPLFCQVREMEKRKEGKPGEARAALRRSVREIGYVLLICSLLNFWVFSFS